MYCIVYLISGAVIKSRGDGTKVSADGLAEFRQTLSELVQKKDGWEVTLDLPTGGFAVIPGHRIDYIEVVP